MCGKLPFADDEAEQRQCPEDIAEAEKQVVVGKGAPSTMFIARSP